jgi:hypothetical protein
VVAVATGTARAADDRSVTSAIATREERRRGPLKVVLEVFEGVRTGVRVGRKLISLTTWLGLMAGWPTKVVRMRRGGKDCGEK